MKTTMTQQEYLKALNALNQKFGLCIKYDPARGEYVLEDIENYDFEYITLEHNPTTGIPEYKA